jgi:peptide/nickel transport system permease protein
MSRRSDSLVRALWHDKAALLGAIFLVLLVGIAVLAPLILSASPTHIDILNRTQPPFWQSGGSGSHLLGTDPLGRDMLARLVYAARVSLLIGASVVVVSGVFGTLMGIAAGYRGGRTEAIIMRVADAQLAFPGLLLTLLVLAFLGSGIPVIIAVLAVYGWMIYARLVRGLVLQLRETPAIQSAKLLGCSTPRILFRHLLPSLYSPLMTQAMLELARVILAEASLSYLGLGVQPPNASWGLMVAENQARISDAWWTVVLPGLALALTTLAVNVVANWLRVQTNPEQRQRRFALSPQVRRRRRRASAASHARQGEHVVRGPQGDGPETVPLLEIEHLDVTFDTPGGEVAAVRDAGLVIRPGETVGIVGESGSGKSSTALALLDLVPPPGRSDAASIRWEGREIGAGELRAMRGSDVTMIFQDPMTSLNPLVPVGRQVGEMLTQHRGMSAAQARERTVELFELVGIPSPRRRLKQFPHQLSGGLRQRVMIAIALASEPKLLVADEPTTALDATIQAQILDMVADLQRRLGIAVLVITHDLGVVARICDRVIVMYGGRVVEEAAVNDLFARPHHRYTQALLEAVPRVDHHGGALPTIPGRPPGRLEDLPGCPFAPRCAHATEECQTMPPTTEPTPGRRFACWHPVGGDLLPAAVGAVEGAP